MRTSCKNMYKNYTPNLVLLEFAINSLAISSRICMNIYAFSWKIL